MDQSSQNAELQLNNKKTYVYIYTHMSIVDIVEYILTVFNTLIAIILLR